jgi:hypothetical protein
LFSNDGGEHLTNPSLILYLESFSSSQQTTTTTMLLTLDVDCCGSSIIDQAHTQRKPPEAIEKPRSKEVQK